RRAPAHEPLRRRGRTVARFSSHRTRDSGKQEHLTMRERTAKARDRKPRRAKRAPEPSVVVRRSAIQGRGVFAARDIKRGERIIEYVGERITHAEASKRYDDEEMRRHH